MSFCPGPERVTRLFFCVALYLLWAGEYRWAPVPGILKTSILAFLLGWHQLCLLQDLWRPGSPRNQDTRSRWQERQWLWNVTRLLTMTICTGTDKTWDMVWGWSITPMVLATLRKEKSLTGTTSRDQIQRISPWPWRLLSPPGHLCTSVPAVTPQHCTAASSLHIKRS